VADTGDMKSSAQNLQRKVEESTRVIEELRRDLSRARDEALIDSLTGILNRKGFDDRIHALLSHPSSSSENCLVMLDIDHFKRVNDTHGHVMGDRVIQSLGELLRSSVKNPAHCAARYGGEEFALLMPGCSIEDSMAHAAFVRQQIKAMTIRDRRKDGPSISVTVSLGVTALRSGDDAARFIARADSALYTSKNDGTVRVTFA
jgi:diguanylate cyclase